MDIVINKVTKTYPDQAHAALSLPGKLEFLAEHTHGVLGHSGCGKSTLLNSLLGRIEFPSGPSLLPLTSSIQQTTRNDVEFVDTPGFDDNRDEEEATCAALGVPLATHYAKKTHTFFAPFLFFRKNKCSK